MKGVHPPGMHFEVSYQKMSEWINAGVFGSTSSDCRGGISSTSEYTFCNWPRALSVLWILSFFFKKKPSTFLFHPSSPKSAITPPPPACSVNGASGTCKQITDCNGSSISGKCPGAWNIQCCIESHATCYANGEKGWRLNSIKAYSHTVSHNPRFLHWLPRLFRHHHPRPLPRLFHDPLLHWRFTPYRQRGRAHCMSTETCSLPSFKHFIVWRWPPQATDSIYTSIEEQLIWETARDTEEGPEGEEYEDMEEVGMAAIMAWRQVDFSDVIGREWCSYQAREGVFLLCGEYIPYLLCYYSCFFDLTHPQVPFLLGAGAAGILAAGAATFMKRKQHVGF